MDNIDEKCLHKLHLLFVKHEKSLLHKEYTHYNTTFIMKILLISVKYNYLDGLKFFYKYVNVCNQVYCYLAAKNGYIECLKFLVNNGCLFNQHTCALAVVGNHLNYIKFLVDNGCVKHKIRVPSEKNLCVEAAKCGNLRILIYAIDSGFFMYEDSLTNAIEYRNRDCEAYIKTFDEVNDKEVCRHVRMALDRDRFRDRFRYLG